MLTRAWREPSPGRVSRLCRLVPRPGRGRDGVGGYGCGRARLDRMNWRWLASPSAQSVAIRASRLRMRRLSLLASAAEEEPEEQAANRGRGDDHDDVCCGVTWARSVSGGRRGQGGVFYHCRNQRQVQA